MSESSSSDGREELGEYEYEVVSVNPGCTAFQVEQIVTLYFRPPPPKNMTVDYGGSCTAVQLRLIEA